MDPSGRLSVGNTQDNSVEYAKSIARKMFELYDRDRSSTLESYEISPMIQDAYKNMNKVINPSKFEIDGYAKIMDRNGDGKVTLADLETLCIKYLCGENALTQARTSYKTHEESIKRARPGSYLPDRPYNASPGMFAQDEYNYTSESQRTGGFGNYDSFGGYGGREETVKRGGVPTGSTYVDDPLKRSAIYIQRGKLDHIRRVFDKFDEDKNGEIDEHELKNLMEETYRTLGVNRQITNEDVQNYFKLIDSNRDGRITYPEYESIVTKALERINVKFE